MTDRQCVKTKLGLGVLNRCRTAGKIQRDGEWWCGTHDPEHRTAMMQARERQVQAEYQAFATVEALEGEIDDLVARHPDFKGLNAKLKVARTQYHQLYQQRSRVGLRPQGI